MVHIHIEKLLSTYKNRELYEALWSLSFEKKIHNENLKNLSIGAICDDLISLVRNEDLSARSFVFSTNLAFGALRLYKEQIDKLCDQTKFALQSCKSTFYNINWLNEMTQKTSTPFPKSLKSIKKSAKKKAQNKSEKKDVLDCLDMIESIFHLSDNENDEKQKDQQGSIKKRKYDSGIDSTIVTNVFDITIKDPVSLMKSGFNTFNEYDEGFGNEITDDFQNLFSNATENMEMDSDMNDDISYVHQTLNNTKRSKKSKELNDLKKRRLTYMNNDDSIDQARYVAGNQMDIDFDIYEQTSPNNDRSSKLSDIPNISNQIPNNQTAQFEPSSFGCSFDPMEVDFEPSLPTTTLNNETKADHTMTEDMDHESENNMTTANETSKNDEVSFEPDSTLILDEISQMKTPKYINRFSMKKKSLTVDKHINVTKDTIRKSIQLYKEKMTERSPFNVFEEKMFYYKHCSDVLFSSGSSRLKKSKLHFLYVRNMKKIPNKITKKNSTRDVMKGVNLSSNELRRSGRKKLEVIVEQMEEDLENYVIDASKADRNITRKLDKDQAMNVDIQNLSGELGNKITSQLNAAVQPMDVDIENIPPNMHDIDLLRPNVFERSTRSSDILEKLNNMDGSFLNEDKLMTSFHNNSIINLPSDIQKLNVTTLEANEQNCTKNVSRRRVILLKLQKFWKQKDQSITMNKLCAGMSKFEAAGIFFEILHMKKDGLIDLVQEAGFLEISNILLKMSRLN